ncbi:MAG: hypothetical protein LBL00_01650 [Endomicrobium sp.]|jgi:flavin-binding protein dodecin|nr:hypothetical protein [Endomicrobium sp.]
MKNAVAIMIFSALFIIALVLKHNGYVPWGVNILVLAAGMFLYFESFNKYKRLRLIRDTATSKIGSCPMGFVEVYGKAKRLSQFSEIYHYLSVIEGRSKRTIREILRGRLGLSALDSISDAMSKTTFTASPFYIEDGTGKVFVDPFDAEIIVDYKTYEEGDYLCTEAEIKEGDYVYCIGTAQRKDSIDIADEINKAIQRAKRSADTVKRFDVNNDGKISDEEWAQARKTIRNEVINKNLNRNKNDVISINKGKDDSIFIISSRKESALIKEYYIQSFILLLSGIALTAYSLIASFKN